MMLQLSAEDAVKHGGELIRYLLDKSPLQNNRRYVAVTSQLQYLKPGFSSVHSIILPRNDWHIDSSGMVSRDIMYLLQNETDCNTEFNANPISFEQFHEKSPMMDFHQFINHSECGLMPQMIQGNRVHTFGCKNIHRASNPTKPTFRFIWRVVESDVLVPFVKSEETFGISYVYKYRARFPNIQQVDNGIVIHE